MTTRPPLRPRRHGTLAGPVGLLATLLTVLLAACGTTEAPVAPAAPAAAPTAPAAGPVSITDSRGKQIELAAPATRLVVLEWAFVEYAVSVGAMPVGVADVKGYGAWVKAEPLDDSVADVGERGEPSIDSIAALTPDLIIAGPGLEDTALGQMEAIAPVAVVSDGDAQDNIGLMRRNVATVADLTGHRAEVAGLLSAFDAKLADGKAKLAARAGQTFVFADAYVENSQVSIRPYAPGSLLSDVTEQLGLKNAWTEPGDAQYGLGESDVEGLTAVGGTNALLYIVNDADGGDPFGNELARNPIWTSLPVVQAGGVHRLPDGIWMFGGPRSLEQYVDAVVTALA